MAARNVVQVKEHIKTYFGGFKFPDDFEIEDLPRLWKAQKLDIKYNVSPVLAVDGLVEFHYLKPDAPVEDVTGAKRVSKAKKLVLIEDENNDD